MALEVGKVACPNTIFLLMAFFKTFIHGNHSSKIMEVKKKMWARDFRPKSSFQMTFFKFFIHLWNKMRKFEKIIEPWTFGAEWGGGIIIVVSWIYFYKKGGAKKDI